MTGNRRFKWLVCILFILTVMMSACGSPSKSSNPETPPSGTNTPAPEPGAKDPPEGTANTGANELVIAWLSDPPSMDPHMSTDQQTSVMTTHIYNTLVIHDKDLNIQPGLAESWKAIDELTWEFKLRQGVKFTDGSPFNAEVVKANIDRMQDPEVASPRASLVGMIKEVKVVDEYTVQLVTEYAFSPLLAHLAHSAVSMISAEAIKLDYEKLKAGEKAGAYLAQNPVGTGVFKLESWNPGQEVKLVANADYWGDKAKVERVTFKVVSEEGTRIAELETGYAHIIDPVSPSSISRIESTDGMSLNRQASLSLSYIGFNNNKEPFNDVRVRQALSMAINKDEIISGIYEGTGIPAVGPLAPDVNGYDATVKPIEHNIDKAKELMKEAGYEGGFSTTIWTNDNPERIKIAEYVQSKLKELNVEVKIEVVEWGAYLAQTAEGKHDMFVLGWSTVTADADYGMYELFHSKNVGEPGNRTFTKDPELDKLLDDGRKENDPEQRKLIYKQAQEKLVELAPMLYIHHQEYLNGVSSKVEGFWRHPNGIMQLHQVSIQP
ncbi:ABC transporter substrate-binding protein [Paenibacillus sp. LC231]|uniref:glutathione ABC transporter substrate-binding protein n=1 Tax=unclassified Paenibacillus TaxID=185978 RepID=UPI0008DCCBFA|nr:MULTISPECIES: glutathione ABC transporter substrate-binding protein [unclassified Paenibacillus]MCT1399904.1 glutathione ABC transporter substrate-binding protein [Paenibacillus sp. p3-SID867]OIB03651.1 ABC transporter substrate-binding protein [Paenibacillus sp. LC231]